MDSHEVTKAIKEARPRLSLVSPLVSKIIVGFIVMNILLGLALVAKLGYVVNGLVIAPNEFAFQLWGGVFYHFRYYQVDRIYPQRLENIANDTCNCRVYKNYMDVGVDRAVRYWRIQQSIFIDNLGIHHARSGDGVYPFYANTNNTKGCGRCR